MKPTWWDRPLILWAAGDIRRAPWRAVLLFTALALLTGMVAFLVMAGQALTVTCDRLMDQGPAMVVRRINAGGWAPLPVAQALASARGVAGALNPRVRVWGVVQARQGPVTVTTCPDNRDLISWARMLEQPGRAVPGPGVAPAEPSATLTLTGVKPVTLAIVGRLPAASAMAAQDIVLVHPHDARALLGLLPDQASDLVVDVFHEHEEQALAADLADAFPWPVRITTRAQQRRIYRTDIARRTGAGLLLFLPALLSLAFLLSGIGLWAHSNRPHAGLYHALGWNHSDLIRGDAARALLVGAPAVACGLAGAYILLYCPLAARAALQWFGWRAPPAPRLSPAGLATGMALTLLFVGLPYLTAVLWCAWQAVKADPADLLRQ